MEIINILIAGIGGQGIISASDIIAAAGLATGFDVKKTDSLGMAQRGGGVISHIRLAEKVWSPLIRTGGADILLALEKLEAARWSGYLRPQGNAIINDLAISPPSVNLGYETYPSDEEITSIIKQRASKVCFIPGSRLAGEIGSSKVLNTMMMGCLSCFLPFDENVWRTSIGGRLPQKALELNLKAFARGREEINKAISKPGDNDGR